MSVVSDRLAPFETNPWLPAPAHPWRFWSTLGWFGVAIVVFSAAQTLMYQVFGQWWRVPIDRRAMNDIAQAVSLLSAVVALVLVARWRGPSARAYLGLALPHWRHAVLGFGLITALWVIVGVLGRLFPQYDPGEDLLNQYRAIMANPTALALYWFSGVAMAPLCEEIVFRGFVQRGWSESRLGAFGGLMLATLLFALAHMHYDIWGMAQVFVIGLTLGFMRWRSGSTLLCIMMHAAWNGANAVERVFMA